MKTRGGEMLAKYSEENYDDIYPSILKNQLSFYKRYLLKISQCWLSFCHKVNRMNEKIQIR